MELPSDWTPLHAAVWRLSSLQDVEDLANNYSVKVPDEQGWTPLHLACASEDSMLMSSHQSSNRPSWRRHGSILARPPPRFGGFGDGHRSKALDVLRVLLKHRPNLNIRAKGFCTALHCAANSRWFSHVKLLVEAGAPVYTGPRCSPLCWAAGGSGAMDNVSIYLRQQLGDSGLAQIEADHARDLAESRQRQMQEAARSLGVTLSDDELALQEALMASVISSSSAPPDDTSFAGVLPRVPPSPLIRHGEVNEHGLCAMCASMSIKTMRKAPGHIHMPSLKDLRQSASTCRLCRLIWDRLGVHDRSDQYLISQVIVSLSNGNHFNCTEPDIIRTIDFMLSEGCTCNKTSLESEPLFTFDKCNGLCKPSKQVSLAVYVKKPSVDGIQSGIDIDRELLAESARQIILKWLRTCDQKHKLCQPTIAADTAHSIITPTRVLEIMDGKVRLIDGIRLNGPYLALSHRWVTGPKPQWVTNSDSFQERHEWFTTATLPATLTDAFKITSWLGFKYIWIDSLCIVQDSARDWAVESARMASIYANARCTIFADCAEDDDAGFLRPRRCYASTSIPIGGMTPDETITLNIRQAPGSFEAVQRGVFDRNVQRGVLSDRAWILQERLLSIRILHFGRDQVFWECNECVEAEDGHTVTEDECGDREPQFTKRGCNIGLGSSSLPYRALRDRISLLRRYTGGPSWTNVVTAYSRLKLTHGSDKLPALSGLASTYAKRADAPAAEQYVAGIWSSSIARLLAWTPDCAPSELLQRPSQPRAPSFSWAAVDSPVKFMASNSRDWLEVTEFVSTTTVPENADIYLGLGSSTLVVHGPTVDLITYGPLPERLGSLPKDFIPLCHHEDNNRVPVGRLHPDFLLSPDFDAVSGGTKVTCLHLLTPKREEDSITRHEHDCFLVLSAAHIDGQGVQTYRRLGMGSTETSGGYSTKSWLDKPLFEASEHRTLALV